MQHKKCSILRFVIWPLDFRLHMHWICKHSCPLLHHLTKSVSDVTPLHCPLPLPLLSYSARLVQHRLYRLSRHVDWFQSQQLSYLCTFLSCFHCKPILISVLSLSSVRVSTAVNQTTLAQLVRTSSIYVTFLTRCLLLRHRVHGITS